MSSEAPVILHRTDRFVALDKPSGMSVHHTRGEGRDERSCLSWLRDELGQWVYPVHRLDRATSGVVLFALDEEAAERLSERFRAREVGKTYLAVVRGHVADEAGDVCLPMTKDFERKGSPLVDAVTRYRRLATTELPFAVGPYPTARYSLLEVEPLTGRRHQIRRHLAYISHPILGDTVRGDGRHNRFIWEKLSSRRLLLHAKTIRFNDPFSGASLEFESHFTQGFMGLIHPLFQD